MKKKKKKDEFKGLEKGRTYSTGIISPNPKNVTLLAGFPRIKGSWNNLWRWDTLENVLL